MSRKAVAPRSDDPQARWRRHRILVRVGQVIMAIGALIVVVHWIAHLQPPPGPSGLVDLLVGYPTGGLLVIAGAVLAGRRQP